MSVIAVEGLSLRITLNEVVKMLTRIIRDDFKALNFLKSDCNTYKTCYLQLSEKLDAVEIVERINNILQTKKDNVLNAFVPETVPDLPEPVKPLFLRKKLRKKLGLAAGELSSNEVVLVAHMEILTELQYKYTGLCSLSSKSSHALLEAIGMTVYDRLQSLMANGGEDIAGPLALTERYRKLHPHFGDFQLILDTLHGLQDADVVPHTQLQESDLIIASKDQCRRMINNGAKEQQVLANYTSRIIKKLEQHVSGYDLTESPEDSKEEAARKMVQTQLSKIVPHLPTIMKELMINHNHVTQVTKAQNAKNKYEKMRMYGEPCLPNEAVTRALFKRYSAQRISYRKTIYNLVMFDVSPKIYPRIMEVDGTYLGGSKIVMRSTNVRLHRVSIPQLTTEIKSSEIDDKEEVDFSIDQ